MKNLIPYVLSKSLARAPGTLEELLGLRRLVPCEGLSSQTMGFMPISEAGE